MILKMLRENMKQRDWVEYLPTIAFALHTSIHKSTNYEPLALLLGQKPKIPVECQDYGDEIKNVLDKPDISEEEKNNMIEGFQLWHFAALLANKDKIFGEVKSNIDKNWKCQKHYFDTRNEMPGNVVKKGDIVLKEKQKDKTRKGGKLASQYNESTCTVMDIHQNANLILKNTDTKEILKTPVPPPHVMKYLKRKMKEEMQDTQDVEVDMKDYLDIMSDVNEIDAKRQKISDSDVELDEESSSSRKGLTANMQVKKEMSSPQMLTAKDRADGFVISSSSGKVLTANIQVKKDENSPWMSAANSTMHGVVTTSSSGNVPTA